MNGPIPFRLSPLTLAAFCLCCVGAPLYAQTEPVTLAWDANRETSVAGYIVYVGNASGSYTEQYDVGNQTSFVYTKVSTGRPYYFAVAAYTPGRDIGARSEEIFFLTGPSTGSHVSMSARAAQVGDAIASSVPSTGTFSDEPCALCAGVDPANRYTVDRLADLPGRVTALTPTGDGRLLFITDGRHVRVITGDTLIPDAALSAEDDSTRLAGLVLDPLFDRNRYVYVGEIVTRPDGRRELSIVRYREVASVLAEGAAVVTSIPLPPSGDAPFTIDAARRLYIAVPASRDGFATGSPYAGMVLRFENDGTASRDSRSGSPVLAHGYAEPASLVWSRTRNELWLAGAGADWDSALSRLPLAVESAEWPRAPQSVDLDAGTSIVSLFSSERLNRGSSATVGVETLVLVDDDGTLLRLDATSRRLVPAAPLSNADLGGVPLSAASVGADIYIVLTPVTAQSSAVSEIVRLRQIK